MASWSPYVEPLPESEFAPDPYAEQDLEPWERDYYERYKFEPEEMER